LPYAQQHAVFSDPEPDDSSPQNHTVFTTHFNTISQSSHSSFERSLLTKVPKRNFVFISHSPFLSPSAPTQAAYLVLFYLIILTIIIGEESKLWSSLLYSFPNHLQLLLAYVQAFSSTPFSNTLSLPSFLEVTDQVSHPQKTGTENR
jgi:hypothetical protein